MDKKDRVSYLIGIILDPNAADHEKDDAGMDLEGYDDDRALEVLIKVSQNPSENDIFALEVYGETIGTYWVRRGHLPVETYLALPGRVRASIFTILQNRKPEWIKKFDLLKHGFD